MDKEKSIKIFVTSNWRKYSQIEIPFKINEVELKEELRKIGFMPIDQETYDSTKVYVHTGITPFKEICTGKSRTLEELCIFNYSTIFIKRGPLKELQ